jgi:formylglycine-generating enzyme required for sulfatase activity
VSKVVATPPAQKPTVTLNATLLPIQSRTPTSVPTVEEITINPKDQAEIVFVSSGDFLMGSNPDKDSYFWGAEAPEHTVFLDSYWIYRFEVTQGMYQECVKQKACPLPVMINHPVAKQYGDPRFAKYPVVMVDWVSALAYCQWAGARLPTEAEWEKAARGTDGRLFPWGNDSDANGRTNFLSSSPMEVGSFPLGRSPFGADDMSGNVLEWVNDNFGALYYETSPYENPQGPSSSSRKVIRGGAFNHSEIAGLRTVARASLNLSDTKISVGFRCALGAS